VSSVATSPATATISDVSFATPDRKDSPHHPAISPETRERARRARAAYTRRGRGGQIVGEIILHSRPGHHRQLDTKPARNTGRWWSRLKKHARLRKMNRRGRTALRAFATWLMTESNQKTMTVSIDLGRRAAHRFGVRERTDRPLAEDTAVDGNASHDRQRTLQTVHRGWRPPSELGCDLHIHGPRRWLQAVH
jgi:hypothetical protein